MVIAPLTSVTIFNCLNFPSQIHFTTHLTSKTVNGH